MAVDILTQITGRIREDEAQAHAQFVEGAWKTSGTHTPVPPSKFLGGPFLLICELKKASPSKGLIRRDFDVVQLAKDYEAGGAGALSVLTEKNFFLGSKEYLKKVRAITQLPLLRKDFIFHPAQVYEARDLGADLVLLIAAMLDDGALATLHQLILDLGMTPLVEVHDEAERDRVLPLQPLLLGINNRSLHTFQTDFETAFRVKRGIPASVSVIAESGIESPEQIRRLQTEGFAGALVGESLMRQPDVRQAVAALRSGLA